jgi:hypothetical protein
MSMIHNNSELLGSNAELSSGIAKPSTVEFIEMSSTGRFRTASASHRWPEVFALGAKVVLTIGTIPDNLYRN